jgi:DNA modification methylase
MDNQETHEMTDKAVRYELYAEDCLDAMGRMSDASIDMTFTSPPFKDDDVPGDYWTLYAAWMSEIMRVTSKVAIIINSATRLNRIAVDWPPKRTMVWGKGISQYSWRWNPIFVYQISDSYKVNKYIWCDCFGVEAITGKWKVHKYQDPELLYATIIDMFKDCKTVFDPFMGSGTTGVVSLKADRYFIGCEMDMVNYLIARESISSTLSAGQSVSQLAFS